MSDQILRIDVLPQLIKKRRKELGLTQKELGDLLGIDQRTVSSLENNPASVSVHRLFAVFDALRLHLKWSSVGDKESNNSNGKMTMTVEQLLKNSKII